MPWRTLIELLHIVAVLAFIRLIAALAIWSVPIAQASIGWVSLAAMAAAVVSGLRFVRAAWDRDRGRAGAHRQAKADRGEQAADVRHEKPSGIGQVPTDA